MGIVKVHIQSKFELTRSRRSGNTFLQNFKHLLKIIIFCCNIALLTLAKAI